jgi:hypothetical protein
MITIIDLKPRQVVAPDKGETKKGGKGERGKEKD